MFPTVARVHLKLEGETNSSKYTLNVQQQDQSDKNVEMQVSRDYSGIISWWATSCARLSHPSIFFTVYNDDAKENSWHG